MPDHQTEHPAVAGQTTVADHAHAAAANAAVPVPHLIRHGQLADNDATLYDAAENAAPLPADEPGWLVRLPVWLENRQAALARRHPLGIWIAPDDDIAGLPGAEQGRIDAQGIWLLAIDFPQYTDGRGYSFAQILRTQYGWEGELRAVGDVMIDTIHYQARCGFDSFLVKPGHDPQLALKAFQAFTVRYQRSYPAAETAV